MAAQAGASVWPGGRPVERHERQLRDRQPRVEPDRHAREVVELERQGSLKARIAEAGRRVPVCPRSCETLPAGKSLTASAQTRYTL